MIRAEWFFDIVSPYSWLQLQQMSALPPQVQVVPRAVLLAGLLKHFGQVGPAEIIPKRLHTYRLCQWLADSRGIPLHMPPRHPFNPLPIQRLLTAAQADLAAVRGAYEAVWRDALDPESPATLDEIARRIAPSGEAAHLLERAQGQPVKDALRQETERAAAAGVFGVPTFCVAGELFWGTDAFGMLLDFLRDPQLFQRPAMARLASLPALQRNRPATPAAG